ncbi:uncharacterized protein LOC143894842 [Temnothorax americanus]|uniref:uncharacterized protein LOC143894842 n=1 Tax=Temnothorax americanus TaxID=1964332 RepID=UPI0040692460
MFGTAGIIDRVSYRQLKEAWDSNHVRISFTFDVYPQIYRKVTNRLSTKRTDWARYCTLVGEEIEASLFYRTELFKDDPEGYYRHFVDVSRRAMAVATGSGKPRDDPLPVDDPNKRKISHKWWDVECKEVIRRRKAAFTAYKRSKSSYNWNKYKRSAAIVKRTFKSKKRSSFDKFYAGINRFISLGYVWNIMHIMKNARKNLEWHPWPTKNREEVIKSSIDNLAPPFVGSALVEDGDLGSLDGELDALFVRAKLDRALRMIRKDSSPGLDGVEYKMLRFLPDSEKRFLLELYNVVWSSGSIPEEWLSYQVIFIDKPGREKEEKFSLSQNGFRRGKSCADNLTRIVSDIRTSLCSGEYTLAAFLDVLAAYDCVDYRILMDELIAQDCPVDVSLRGSRKARFSVRSCTLYILEVSVPIYLRE